MFKICPFMIKVKIVKDVSMSSVKREEETYEYSECKGRRCMAYYLDNDNLSKCKLIEKN